jgi:hypothetical protein
MARTAVTVTDALGSYGDYATANAADLTMEAADPSNKNKVPHTGDILLIAHNTGGSAQLVSVTSVDDAYGRQEDIDEYSVGAGEYAVFGPFKVQGWIQSDGQLYFEADSADVKFGVVKLT